MAQLAERDTPAHSRIADYVAQYHEAPGPAAAPWLTRTREAALASFERLGFPTTRLEEWRFTPIGPLVETRFRPAPDGRAPDELAISQLAEGSVLAAVVNGRFAPQLSSIGRLPAGVHLLGLEEAIATRPDLVEPYLARLAPAETQAFAALNTAFLRDGLVVAIDPHVVVEPTLELVFAAAAAHGTPVVSHPRLLVIAGEHSQVRLLERYVGVGPAFTNAITELVVGASAVVDHYKVQEEPADAFHIGGMHLHLARSAHFSSHSLTFGAAIARNDIHAVLDGEGVDCTLNGLYLGRHRQLIDNHTTIDHAQPHCGSHEVYKGILARPVARGLQRQDHRPDGRAEDRREADQQGPAPLR